MLTLRRRTPARRAAWHQTPAPARTAPQRARTAAGRRTARRRAGAWSTSRIPDVADTPTAWEEFTRTFAGNLEGYDQHRITPLLTGGGLVTDWEYTYREDGERLHALNRVVFTGAEAYAVQFVVPDDQWAQTQQDRARVLDSFDVG